MPTNNICNFIPSKDNVSELITLNFVFEQNYFAKEPMYLPTYSINIAAGGTGILHNRHGAFPLKKGDLFLTFPENPFYVENRGDFSYYYITFLGTRANVLMERLHLNARNPVYAGEEELLPLWERASAIANSKNIDLVAEGCLLYSFSFLCKTYVEEERQSDVDIILKIKKYVEENYADPELCLKSVAEKFSYSDHYISEKFKRTLKISFSDYLQKLRIDHALYLIENGIKNVSELASACGYRDPFYFSKVFRKVTGNSPKQQMKS